MKNLFMSTVIFVLMTKVLLAQVPQSFTYQSVLRNNAGWVVKNKAVNLRISVVKTTVNGTAIYTEQHAAITTALGQINVFVGQGSSKTGTFTTIDWGADTYFLKTEIDTLGGTNFVEIGTTQFVSVPFAMYAQKAGSADYNSLTNKPFSITIPANNQLLRYNSTSSKWENWTPDFLTSYNESDPKVGTLTGNYLPKWNTTSLINSVIFDNGNVGIGTATPTKKLEVNGNLKVKGAIYGDDNGNVIIQLGN